MQQIFSREEKCEQLNWNRHENHLYELQKKEFHEGIKLAKEAHSRINLIFAIEWSSSSHGSSIIQEELRLSAGISLLVCSAIERSYCIRIMKGEFFLSLVWSKWFVWNWRREISVRYNDTVNFNCYSDHEVSLLWNLNNGIKTTSGIETTSGIKTTSGKF